MPAISAWPRRLKEFSLTLPLYKSPPNPTDAHGPAFPNTAFAQPRTAVYCTTTTRPVLASPCPRPLSVIPFIVGYQNLELRNLGLTMASPTFLPVGGSTCKLSDLKVTGYMPSYYDDEEEDYVGGVKGGTFVLHLLGVTGVAEETYYWIDFGSILAGWYADKNGTAIAEGSESVIIEQGRAVWIAANGRQLQSSGEVGTSDVAYRTRDLGLSAVGNCTPVDLTLGSLYVSGYAAPYYDDDEEDYVGGVKGGTFVLNLLGPTGTSEATYYWIDFGSVSAGWYADKNGTSIEGGATSVAIPAGKGMWVAGNNRILNIPAPEL